MASHILAIDQGTTGTTCAIFDSDGRRISESSEDFRQIYPQPGWVEHDPEDIWRTVQSTMGQVLKKAKLGGRDIAAIGITNQRETVVVWERSTGRPVYNAIVWQCRRTTEFCEKLKKRERQIRVRTGLVVDPYFSASKIRWILDNVPHARKRAEKGELACGTIDSFLLWRLTGVHATDVTNASRTQLMNIRTGRWDKELLKLFDIPEKVLPEIRPSCGAFGETFGLSLLADGVPVTGMIGDQQSALFGQACFRMGDAKCTYGTGSFLLLNCGNKAPISRSGVLTTVAWQLKGERKLTYALEGSAFICGAAVQWLRDGLGLFSISADIESLASSVPDTGGVEFVPALTGLGAPHWAPEARGLICGLTRGTTKAHLARATLEGMALQNVDLLLAMQKDLGKPVRRLKVDGGAAADNLLMQIQADYLGRELVRPADVETTSAGAAFMAGLGAGIWASLSEIEKVWHEDRKFHPKISKLERGQRIRNWHKAVERTTL